MRVIEIRCNRFNIARDETSNDAKRVIYRVWAKSRSESAEVAVALLIQKPNFRISTSFCIASRHELHNEIWPFALKLMVPLS